MELITPKQLRVLKLIEDGHVTVKAITRVSGITPYAVRERATALRRKGLITVSEVPTPAGGRPAHQYHRTATPVPSIGRQRGPGGPRKAAKPTHDPRDGLFDLAPRLTIDSDPGGGYATREHVEMVARQALANQPQHAGRKAITARHLANLTGMPYLDALGALYRITERQTGGIRVYEPEGRSATFYLGPKYRPTFGGRA